ncbi:Alpha/Beta hydrolase protein [Chytriomyces sp. MP71]|nr:Alpha/Beta hydrolase protein [Chytriomyces sp. MP71]
MATSTETRPLLASAPPDASVQTSSRHSSGRRSVWTVIVLLLVTVAAVSIFLMSPKTSRRIHRTDHAVVALPGETAQVSNSLNGHYSGYIPVTSDGYLFYWYFPTTKTGGSDKLVIWINGGPGCSSMIGQFTENGPFSVASNGSLVVNPYSWHNEVNMLYVDQPTGAGFSFTKPKSGPRDEHEVASQFYTFLTHFYEVYPELQSFALYITGESYAGVYAPWIARHIITQQVLHPAPSPRIHLLGVGVGNPVLSWRYQFDAVAAFDYLREVRFFGADAEALEKAARVAEACRGEMGDSEEPTGKPYGCSMYRYANEWVVQTKRDGRKCLDRLNYKKECVDDALIGGPGLSVYLDRDDVRRAIHVDPLQRERGSHNRWKACDNRVDRLNDTALPEPIAIIPGILAAGVGYLVYEGDLDLSINYPGTERAIGNMTWGGVQGLQGALKEYRVGDVPAGLMASERGFTYLRIYNAGHMVPTDQPITGMDVLKKVISL